MTLVTDIIHDAYRESNLISVGGQTSSAQESEALTALNRLVLAVYGNEVGEKLQSLPIGSNNISQPSGYPFYNQVPYPNGWVVPANTRLILNLSKAQTVYLHPLPEDGARLSINDNSNNLATFPLTVVGNGQSIGGGTSLVFNTSGVSVDYIYLADKGDWMKVSPLISTDSWPFPPEFDDMFVIGLALRLNPRYQAVLDEQSAAVYKKVSGQFKARYRQSREVGSELGIVVISSSRNRFYSYDSDPNEFNTGQNYIP